jgi:hypothetical protein
VLAVRGRASLHSEGIDVLLIDDVQFLAGKENTAGRPASTVVPAACIGRSRVKRESGALVAFDATCSLNREPQYEGFRAILVRPHGRLKEMTLECINPPELPTPETYTQVVVARGTKLICLWPGARRRTREARRPR